MKLTKQQFVDQFVCNFLAVWCANNYADMCALGKHEVLENPPVEDAKFLAEAAWEKVQSHDG